MNSRCALARTVTIRQIKVSSNLVDASSSEKDDSSDSDVLGVDRRKKNGNGGGGRNRVMFRDIGGISGVIEELETDVIVPLHQVKLLRHLGVEPVARILLQGPPGCGKTTLARAIANEAGLPFYEVSAAELVSGAFEENIRALFSKAYMRAPSIVFIDEIDSITSKKENPLKEIESRIVNRLMACMDESCRLIKLVLVIGATSRLDTVDPTLRQQFDREIVLGVPDESAQLEILSVLTCNLKVEVDCDLAKIARSTMGFVGGDLVALAQEAGILAVNRIVRKRNLEISKKSDCSIIRKEIEGNPRPPFSDEEMENFSITMEDFKLATRMVQPSSKIEEFYTIPNAKWDDVVGLQSLKQEFDCHIIRPIKFPDVYEDLGRNSTTSFFLYGPPGCGKTLIVKALANEAGANFIHIKSIQPHDAIFNVLRSDKVTFDKFMYVPPPSPEERGMILKALARNKPIDADVNLMALGKDVACENFRGADLSSLMREAARSAIKRRASFDGGRSIPIPCTIKDADFKRALKKIASDVSFPPRDLASYERFSEEEFVRRSR
ncbi:cell division cycle 48C [Perilla frutescens var. hirtella]|nr:cell division cycle 48C [Perilla frutescens var. hirtella]